MVRHERASHVARWYRAVVNNPWVAPTSSNSALILAGQACAHVRVCLRAALHAAPNQGPEEAIWAGVGVCARVAGGVLRARLRGSFADFHAAPRRSELVTLCHTKVSRPADLRASRQTTHP
jgi:hypothetical protein